MWSSRGENNSIEELKLERVIIRRMKSRLFPHHFNIFWCNFFVYYKKRLPLTNILNRTNSNKTTKKYFISNKWDVNER